MDDTIPVIAYYLGQPVELLGDYGDGWVGARFTDDPKQKVWRMWGEQLLPTPWGEDETDAKEQGSSPRGPGLTFSKPPDPLPGDPIWGAAQGARFFIHTYLLGADDGSDPTGEGRELASEVMAELQAAFEAHFPKGKVPPICSGCSPIEPFEKARCSS